MLSKYLIYFVTVLVISVVIKFVVIISVLQGT